MGRVATYILHTAGAIPQSNTTTNGLVERAARSLKIPLNQLLLGVAVQPSQALITQVAMARNHFPHTSLEFTRR